MRLLSLLAGTAVLGGCATLGLVDAGETALDPGTAVVALSVDTRETAGVVAGDLRLKSVALRWDTASPVAMGTVVPGVDVAMLQTAEQTLTLGELQLVWQSGANRHDLYAVVEAPPVVSVLPGKVVYLGNIRIRSVQYDAETGRPQSVTLVIEDAWDEDLTRWYEAYELAAAVLPEKRILPDWGGATTLTVERIRPTYDPGFTYNPDDFRNPPPPAAPHIPTGGGGRRGN